MSISELMPMPERARRIEVFTGAGRRRNWPADEKAAIVAESYAPGKTVCGVARRHGLTPAQLFTWRRLARRVRLPVLAHKSHERRCIGALDRSKLLRRNDLAQA